MSASSTSGLTSASPAASRRATRRSDLMLSRVAASPSSRERRATAASARASQPGTRCASAASISSSAHSGTTCDEKQAATSPSPSHVPGSATATTRKPSAASSREPSGRSTIPSWSARESAAARTPRCKRCAPSRMTEDPARIASMIGPSRHVDAPVAGSVARLCNKSRAVRSLWQVWSRAAGATRAAMIDLPPPAGPTSATCSPFFRSDCAAASARLCVAESQRAPSARPAPSSAAGAPSTRSTASTASFETALPNR